MAIDGTSVLVGVAVGWVLAKGADVFAIFANKAAAEERLALFERGLTKGDPVALYNLRLADQVSQNPEVVKGAIRKELERQSPPPPQAVEPWADHPLYKDCDITFDLPNGVVNILRPNAADGPDFWTEPLDEFMAKFALPTAPA